MATSVKQSSFSLFRSPAKAVKTSFQVNEVWKGHVAPTMEVHTAAGSDSCGFEFQEGERYLVYARSTGSALEVSLCSGTILHGTAFEHVAALGSGSIPPQPAETIQQSSGLPWRFILLFSAIGCSLTIMFVFRKKQRKSKSKT
jgi:hypothetical protein